MLLCTQFCRKFGTIPRTQFCTGNTTQGDKQMNPILQDIYSTIIPSAPFIIAAYALFWVVLLVYVIKLARTTQKLSRDIDTLEALIKQQQ
ncbi:hypothetical protein HMPREF3190_01665 [Umbribacter vaginalis]|nr:hypothetical protein HMPREF3190_01665 [Coriobacteriales bacterium DNF00809]